MLNSIHIHAMPCYAIVKKVAQNHNSATSALCVLQADTDHLWNPTSTHSRDAS